MNRLKRIWTAIAPDWAGIGTLLVGIGTGFATDWYYGLVAYGIIVIVLQVIASIITRKGE